MFGLSGNSVGALIALPPILLGLSPEVPVMSVSDCDPRAEGPMDIDHARPRKTCRGDRGTTARRGKEQGRLRCVWPDPTLLGEQSPSGIAPSAFARKIRTKRRQKQTPVYEEGGGWSP